MNKSNQIIKEALIYNRLKDFLDSTSGIVHNLSNPLTIISTRSQLMQLQMPENPNFIKMVEQIKLIEKLLNNMVFISQNILNDKPQQININTFLKNEIEYFRSDAFFKHSVTTTLDPADEIVIVTNSYFHISILLFSIIKLALHCFQSSEKKLIYISIDRQAGSVLLNITISVDNITDIMNDNEFKPFVDVFNNAILISQEVDISTRIQQKKNGTEFIIVIPDIS